MMNWVLKYQKALSMGIGSILLLAGIVMLFWDMRGTAVSEEERLAAERVARYEARMAAETGQQPPSDKPMISNKFKEYQEKQLRLAVILLIGGGACFMGYGLYRRYQEKKAS